MLSRSFLRRLKSALGFYLSWDFRRGKTRRRLFLGPVESVRLAWNLARLEEAEARARRRRQVMAITTPGSAAPRIDSLFVYLSQDADGNEGLCTSPPGSADGGVPLIAGDAERLEALTPIAEQLAAAAGMTIVLAEFSTRKDLSGITPGGA